MLYFRGSGLDSAIQLEWATGTELDTAGFMIERSNTASGVYVTLDGIGFIGSQGSPDGLTGAEYELVDDSGISNGSTYWYRLIEVERDGAENRSNPISVLAGEIEASATSNPTENSTTVATNPPSTAPADGPTATPTLAGSGGTRSTSELTATPGAARTITLREDSTDGGVSAGAGINQNPNEGSDSLGSVPSQIDPTSEGYPAPSIPASGVAGTDTLDNSYPSEGELETGNSVLPYPVSENSIGTLDVPDFNAGPGAYPDANVIGRVQDDQSVGAAGGSEQESLSTVMLWAGFLSSFVIFVAAVVGSIIYYRRQNPK